VCLLKKEKKITKLEDKIDKLENKQEELEGPPGGGGGTGAPDPPGGGTGKGPPVEPTDINDDDDQQELPEDPDTDFEEEEEVEDGIQPVPDDFGYSFMILKPEGGRGKIIGIGAGVGPRYNIDRLNVRDIDPGFSFVLDLAISPEWTDVLNLAEPEDSPGLLPNGTFVNVSIYEDKPGLAVAFIEQVPPAFGIPSTG